MSRINWECQNPSKRGNNHQTGGISFSRWNPSLGVAGGDLGWDGGDYDINLTFASWDIHWKVDRSPEKKWVFCDIHKNLNNKLGDWPRR